MLHSLGAARPDLPTRRLDPVGHFAPSRGDSGRVATAPLLPTVGRAACTVNGTVALGQALAVV
jgi:hypothetical protein